MTREQNTIFRWMTKNFDPGSARQAEPLGRNAVRITTRSYDNYLLICRQDGTVQLMDDVEAC